MTYVTLMVHLTLGSSNAGVLQIAGDLAERFHANVIGIAACQPIQVIYGDGEVAGDIVELDRQELEKEIKAAEAEFRSALHTRIGNLEWRSTVTLGPLSDYLAHEARSADLFISGVDLARSMFDASRHVNMSDLVMQVGRPTLVVPPSVGKLKFERVIVGWKETREARRAALDALPFLKQAAHVAVVEIADEKQLMTARTHLEDVVGWLKKHGIVAEAIAAPSSGDDAAHLNAIAREQGADLIVAGAYGHSRLREWVLGGMTRELLLRADRCAFLSH